MKKSVLVLLASMVLGTVAQARTLYWTGHSSGQTYEDCRSNAYYAGDRGARRSCVNDYGIRYSVCENAPVSKVEDISYNYDYRTGWHYCSVRVYINVP